MSDRWLEELVRVANEDSARERQQLDERWDRLAAGTLDADELAALRAEAEGTAEGRAAWEAFRPLGTDFEAQVVARLQADTVPAATLAPVVPLRSRVPLFAGIGLLAAGLTAFALLRPFLNPPLPDYTISYNSGDRSGKAISIGQPATLSLQPKKTRRGQVKVQCWQLSPDAVPKYWSGCETHLESLPDGTLRVDLPAVATEELATGTLRVFVARPGRFPAGTETRDIDPEGRWQAFSVPIQAPLP
ncbi:MAG: hypothetical protein SF066_10030 [Thermoanaerobaculia bacterium]|nr:hypothetical protein [Thermoanaerobaculia bacterium]